MMDTMDTITLILAALATARITRLITSDRITEAPRGWVLRRLDEGGLLAYLIVCNWCASVYVGAGMAGAWYAWGGHRWFAAVCAALAFSYVAGFLASREGEA